MRKFLYTLVGVVLMAVSVYALGVRQFDVGRAHEPYKQSLGQRALEWSVDGEPRTWFDAYGPSTQRTSWFTASRALDLLNALLGVLGIALMFNGANKPSRVATRE